MSEPSPERLANRIAVKKYRAKNRLKINEQSKQYRKDNPVKTKAAVKSWRRRNPDIYNEITKRYVKKSREENPALWLWYSAKKRAKVRGHEFNLDKEDIVIPDVCPVLGMPIFKGYAKRVSNNSPNLDRLDNNKGYVKGNVMVISALANRIKTNATQEEVQKVADWMKGLVVGL